MMRVESAMARPSSHRTGSLPWPVARQTRIAGNSIRLGDDGTVAAAAAAPRVDGDAAGEVEHGDKFRHHGYLTPREGS